MRSATTTPFLMALESALDDFLLADEPEMMEAAKTFFEYKYKQVVDDGEFIDSNEAHDVLTGLLPLLTPEELEEELTRSLDLIMATSDST